MRTDLFSNLPRNVDGLCLSIIIIIINHNVVVVVVVVVAVVNVALNSI